MPASDHPAYQEEKERLDYTLSQVERALDSTLRRKNDLDQEIRRLDRECTDENSQAFIDLIVKTNIQSGLALKLRNLHAARNRPYFARVDFREDGAREAERLYIGKMCLLREEDQSLVIVDWRASVANLYYEGRLGRAGYDCPAGRIEGEIGLKRQFSIANGRLQEIVDLDITTTDEFLGACLGANARSRLKEIVSTIQIEQNRIIRAAMETPLIVQGAAGSGKTTIALHRLAYLIYNCGESFQPEEFMIIAPNRLFLNYISEVLPELGVERVRQATFEDFAREVLGEELALEDPHDKLLRLLEEGAAEDERRLVRAAAEFKSSLAFKDLLERYIEAVEDSLLPREDLRLRDWGFATAEEIHGLFYDDYRSWPTLKRLEMLRRYLAKRIKERVEEIGRDLQEQCESDLRQIKEAMEDSETRRMFILQTIGRKEEALRRLDEFARRGLQGYFQRIPRRRAREYYREFLAEPEFFRAYSAGVLPGDVAEFLRERTLAGLARGVMEIEDLAPLLYLQYRLIGLEGRIRLRHLVLDEAQDFSLFQLHVLRRMFREASFTILGDLAQGIHSYRGIRDWERVRREVFGDCGSALLTLERSYRTTIEIMTAANRVLSHLADPALVKATPVLRRGGAVRIVGLTDPAALAREMAERILDARRRGLQTVAVVCKTGRNCEAWRHRLREAGVEATVITGRETEYNGGVVIVPAYLAKGLEFDVVLIADADRETYRENELDVKLLYVAMTRALHELHVYHGGEATPLLADF